MNEAIAQLEKVLRDTGLAEAIAAEDPEVWDRFCQTVDNLREEA
jgi:hypothetical protein